MIYDENDDDDDGILESFNVSKWKCKENNIIITSSSYVSFVSQLPLLRIICVTLSGESSYNELMLATVYKNEWVEINIYFFNWRKKRWENHCLDPWELKQNQLDNLQQKLSLWWWHLEISNHFFFLNYYEWKYIEKGSEWQN